MTDQGHSYIFELASFHFPNEFDYNENEKEANRDVSQVNQQYASEFKKFFAFC